MPDITIFKYENEHITIHLASLHKTDWKSDDEFYTLRSRWERNALCYLPPVGIWTKLAFFEDQKFVNISDGTKKIFEKISEDKIVGWDRAILNPRSLFKYGSEASGDKAS